MGKGARNRDLRRRALELFASDPAVAKTLLNEPALKTPRSLARKLRRTRA